MTTPSSYLAKLSVHQLTFDVHLGYGETERATPQPVAIELDVFLSQLPAASYHGSKGFMCYDMLATMVQDAVKDKEFYLIEHLAVVCGGAVDAWVTKEAGDAQVDHIHYTLRLHKCTVPVDAVKGGTSFTFTTLPHGLLGH